VGSPFKRVRRDAGTEPKHDTHLVLIHLNPFDQGPNNLAACLPIGWLQSPVYWGRELLYPPDEHPELAFDLGLVLEALRFCFQLLDAFPEAEHGAPAAQIRLSPRDPLHSCRSSARSRAVACAVAARPAPVPRVKELRASGGDIRRRGGAALGAPGRLPATPPGRRQPCGSRRCHTTESHPTETHPRRCSGKRRCAHRGCGHNSIGIAAARTDEQSLQQVAAAFERNTGP